MCGTKRRPLQVVSCIRAKLFERSALRARTQKIRIEDGSFQDKKPNPRMTGTGALSGPPEKGPLADGQLLDTKGNSGPFAVGPMLPCGLVLPNDWKGADSKLSADRVEIRKSSRSATVPRADCPFLSTLLTMSTFGAGGLSPCDALPLHEHTSHATRPQKTHLLVHGLGGAVGPGIRSRLPSPKRGR